MYINDLGNLQLKGVPRLFADDTALFYSSNDVNTIIEEIDSDLVVLSRFFNANLLSLNLSKTKYMIFHSARKRAPPHNDPKFLNSEIEKVDKFKYLGLNLDHTLSWTHHIQQLESKVASLCGIMWRVSMFVPRHVLLKFYFAHVHSRLNYLILVWGRACMSHLKKLQTLQNRCLKIVFKKPLLYSTLLLYSDACHNILPIKYLCDMQTMVFVHNILFNPLAHCNIQLPTLASNRHSRVTRQSNNLSRPRAATNIGQRRISFIGPTRYNSLPPELKRIENLNTFKLNLKRYFKEKLNELFH